jgi:predicted porin
MKKTLIALAALAATGAFAQSSVTIYGQVDLGVATVKDSFAAGVLDANAHDFNQTGVTSGKQYTSRIGFKGTEDLGGGLKANFALEYALTPNVETNAMKVRTGTVGLSGDFGALTVGRMTTPYYNVEIAMDLVGGGNNNLGNTPGYVVSNHNLNGGRVDNAVQYTTPNINGFTGAVQVSSGANSVIDSTSGKETVGKGYGLSGIYAAGPLVAGVAYQSASNPGKQIAGLTTVTGALVSNVLGDLVATGGTSANVAGFGLGSSEVKVWVAGASYDFGVAKASLAYSDLTDKQQSGAADVKSKGYNLSVAVPFGATTVAANLGRATLEQAGVFDGDITGYQLLASYALSKRTNAYATYGNDKLDISGAGEVLKRTSTAVGIRHTF